MTESITPNDIREIEITAPADWWMLAPILRWLVRLKIGNHADGSEFMDNNGYHFNVAYDRGAGNPIARFVTSGHDGITVIRCILDAPEYADACTEVLQLARYIAEEGRDLRRKHVSMTNDEAIEVFYRQRAAGGKASLRQIAERFGMNYVALLKHKQRYDAAGKWGARAKTSIPTKTEVEPI